MDSFPTGAVPPALGPDITITFRRNNRTATRDAPRYTISANRLQYSSIHFRTLFKHLKEPNTSFVWPDEDAWVRYLHWLETRIVLCKPLPNIQTPQTKRKKTPVSPSDTKSSITRAREELDYATLIDLYLLGEKLQDGLFKDTIMSFLQCTLGLPEADPNVFLAILTPERVQKTWEFTAQGSELRRFVVDSITRFADAKKMNAFFGEKYEVKFEDTLQSRLDASVLACLLPVEVLARLEKKIERVLVDWPPSVKNPKGVTVKGMSCEEMVKVAIMVVQSQGEGWEEQERCRYHEHAPVKMGGLCWWQDE